MATLAIIGLTILIVVVAGFAGAFMARATTSTNLAQFSNAGRMLRGIRPRAWISSGVRGELGSKEDGDEPRS